jgi:acyl carrier protein phosphodiesterase
MLLTGNIIADMVKGKLKKDIPAEIAAGMKLHLLIDHFTDTHAATRQMCDELTPFFKRYAPVMVDIFLDFHLGSEWERVSIISFPQHEDWVYESLKSQSAFLPEKISFRLKSMISHRWLNLYRDKENLPEVTRRLSLRSSQPGDFSGALEIYNSTEDKFKPLFYTFFNDMRRYIDSIYIDQKPLG